VNAPYFVSTAISFIAFLFWTAVSYLLFIKDIFIKL
jgi:hypothetical protein